MTMEVTLRGANAIELNSMKKGQLVNPTAGVWDRAGNPLSADKIKEIQGSSKAADGTTKTSFIDQVVESGKGYPPGTLKMVSHTGDIYFVEGTDPEIINSVDYSSKLINMASQTNTGALNVTTRSPIGDIPIGTYQVEHVPPTKDNPSPHKYNLYKNGKLAYRKYQDKYGNQFGVAVNQDND